MAQLPEIGACMLLCVAPLAGEGGAHPLRSSPSAFCSRSHPGGWDLLKPGCLEPVLCDKRSSRNEKPMHSKDPVQPKINKIFFKLKKKKQRIKQMWTQASEGFRDRMGRWHVREPC